MKNTIHLTNNCNISLPIKFFISAKVCQNANLSDRDVANIGAKVSASPSLYIHRYPHTHDDGTTVFRYDVFSVCGVFTCEKRSQFGNYAVIFFTDKDFSKKRQAIDKGISFSFNKNILLSIQYGAEFLNYESGKKVSRLSTDNCSRVFNFIDQQFDATKSEFKPSSEISEELAALVKRAEAYSDTDYTLEEAAALIDGKLFYESVSPSENADGDSKNYIFHCILSAEQQKKTAKRNLEKKWAVNKVVQVTLNDGTNISVPIYSAKLSGKQPSLELIFTKQVDFSAIPSSGFIQIPLNNTVKNTQRKAINQIREQNTPAQFLDDVLGKGICKPHKAENMAALTHSFEAREHPLNASQCTAIKEAISSQDIYLVMGPPGTGKTTVITEWVKYFVCEKKARVLIASQNNSAVDNVLKKLKDEPYVEMLRISGNEQKVDDDVADAFYRNKVNQTRAAISKKVSANQQELLQLQEKWKKIEASYDVLAAIYDEYRQAKQRIDDNISSAADSYKKARSLVPEISRQATKFQRKFHTFSIIETVYDAYYYFEPIREIFFYIGAILRRILKSKAKRLDSIRATVQSNIDTYNENIDRYNRLIHKTLTELAVPMHSAAASFRESISSLDILSVANDAFGIFSIAPQWLDNMEDIRNFHIIFDVLSAGRIKLDSACKILEKWNEHITNTQNYAVESILLQGANVVGATCVGISSNPYASNLDFDVVIIDEAGQIQIHNCLIPMRLGKKVIMLGDHKQLPPVARLEALNILEGLGIDWSLYTQSLFEYLYKILPNSNKTMLDTQFRMPKVIADILSDAFYEGKYQSHKSKHSTSSGIQMFDNKPFVVINTADSERRREDKVTHTNDYEAEICEKIFTKLTRSNTQKDGVAIIAGLNDQVDLIWEKIAAKHGPDVARHVVHTVDSYQGRECDTVIFSFTRSSLRTEDEVRIGFLSELRRLNVAMSRCKRCLVLIGDMEFLTQCKNTTGYAGTAERGITGTEEKFSQFLEKIISSTNTSDALCLPSKQFYERLVDES